MLKMLCKGFILKCTAAWKMVSHRLQHEAVLRTSQVYTLITPFFKAMQPLYQRVTGKQSKCMPKTETCII